MSQARALKTIMKWSDKDIKENLEEIRLEKGISAELEKQLKLSSVLVYLILLIEYMESQEQKIWMTKPSKEDLMVVWAEDK